MSFIMSEAYDSGDRQRVGLGYEMRRTERDK
jgi:hypothetical protein